MLTDNRTQYYTLGSFFVSTFTSQDSHIYYTVMQLIKPSQISGDIMTLLDEADEQVVLITPYFKVKHWYKLINRLKDLQTRNINVQIFIRAGEAESEGKIRAIGFNPILVPNLHTKLYLNEKTGIVSSMNLLYSSDTNSLDIALKTENEKEYSELWEYYLRYILRTGIDKRSPQENLSHFLNRQLSIHFEKLRINELPDYLEIYTSNRYSISVKQKGQTNSVLVVGILSSKEFSYALKYPALVSSNSMRIEYVEGKNGTYNTVTGILSPVKSTQINSPLKLEIAAISSAIVEFILCVEELKKKAYKADI